MELLSDVERMGGTTSASVLRRRARRLEIGTLGLLLTTTAGACYALWRGTQFLQALRSAQLDFAPYLASEDVSTYPRFVEAVLADWPARVAAHVPTVDDALRVVLVVSLGFVAFAAHRVRPEGEDVEAGDLGGDERRQVIAKAREISGFRGRLLIRPEGYDAAISTRADVYLPAAVCEMIDRIAGDHAAEELAFVIVHERSHAESMDNALWSLGSVNNLLVAGLLSVLLVPASFPAAVILVPDRLVRAVPYAASIGLAAVVAAAGMAVVGTVTVGLLTSLTAARECSADAIAAAVVGAEHLPYQRDDRGPRTALDAWRQGCAVADRLLHVRGVFPRRGALEALAVGTWAAVRTALALAMATPYSLPMAVFDVGFLGSLATTLSSLPRAGSASHSALPVANLVATLAVVGVTLWSIDAFSVGEGLRLFFGTRWQVALLAPPLVVMSALVASARLGSGRPEPVDRTGTPSVLGAAGDLSLFVASVPSWAISYITGGLCAFVAAGVLADALVGPTMSSMARVVNLVSVAACVPLLLLIAKNMRCPTRASVVAEAALAVPVAAIVFYIGNVVYEVAAEAGLKGSGLGDLQARLASLDVRSLPSPALAIAFAGIVAASWLARRWLSRSRSRAETRP